MARAKGIPALELYRLAQKKKRKLVLCGHSLGGAVSLITLLSVISSISLLAFNVFIICSTLDVSVGSCISYPRNLEGHCGIFCIKRK